LKIRGATTDEQWASEQDLDQWLSTF